MPPTAAMTSRAPPPAFAQRQPQGPAQGGKPAGGGAPLKRRFGGRLPFCEPFFKFGNSTPNGCNDAYCALSHTHLPHDDGKRQTRTRDTKGQAWANGGWETPVLR